MASKQVPGIKRGGATSRGDPCQAAHFVGMAGAADEAAAEPGTAGTTAADAPLGATGAPSAASSRLGPAAWTGAGTSRWVAITDRPSVAAKNTVAHTAVERERKFALPVAP